MSPMYEQLNFFYIFSLLQYLFSSIYRDVCMRSSFPGSKLVSISCWGIWLSYSSHASLNHAAMSPPSVERRSE